MNNHILCHVPEPVSYQGLLQAFLSGKSERTMRAYSGDLADFQGFMLAGSVSHAARLLLGAHGRANAHVLAYKQSLIERGLSSSTVNRRLAAIRSLVKMARTLGLIDWTLDVPNMKSKSYRDTRGPGVEGVQKMLEKNDTRSDAKGIRDQAIIRLLFDLGLRRGEVAILNIEDVDLQTCRVSVVGKGKREADTLTMPSQTVEALQRWINNRGLQPGPLFLNLDRARKGSGRLTDKSIYRIVKTLGDGCGIKARPHGLRHTSITAAIELAQKNGVGLEEVRDFSRHTDVKTLMIYRDRSRDVQGMLAGLVAGSLHTNQEVTANA
jgi:integrase/recombinase XerC